MMRKYSRLRRKGRGLILKQPRCLGRSRLRLHGYRRRSRALGLRRFNQGFDCRKQRRCLKGFLEHQVRTGARSLFFVNALQQPRGQHDARMAVPRMRLYELAYLVARFARQINVREDKFRVGIRETHERGLAIADRDDLIALVAQDALAHALGVGAVVGQQDSAHDFFFLPSFLASGFAGGVCC